mgnify:CR=1 FL=1
MYSTSSVRDVPSALSNTIEAIAGSLNPELKIEGIVVNQFQARAKMPQRVVAELKAEGQPLLDASLSSSVRVKESHELHRPMIHLDPTHRVTQEYIALYDQLGR